MPFSPNQGDERQTFRGTTRIRAESAHLKRPDNGGQTRLVSKTAPGRTKRCRAGRLTAGDRPSLWAADSLFSRSTPIDYRYL